MFNFLFFDNFVHFNHQELRKTVYMICKSDESDRRPVIIQTTTSNNKDNETSKNNINSSPVRTALSSAEKAEKERLSTLENVYLEMKGELNVLRHLSTSQLQQKSPPHSQTVLPQTPAGDIYYLAPPTIKNNNNNNVYTGKPGSTPSNLGHHSTANLNQNQRLVTPDSNHDKTKSRISSKQSTTHLVRKFPQFQVLYLLFTESKLLFERRKYLNRYFFFYFIKNEFIF